MKKLIALLLVCSSMVSYAQNGTLSGMISDNNGAGIGGVNVNIRGTGTSTQTNNEGKFTISAKSNAVLVISHVSYQTREIQLNSLADITIVLELKAKELSEAIVTSLGITRVQKSLGYSVSTIKSDELLKARETSVINSLAGKVAGLRIGSQSGTVGGASKIVIRGVSSLSAATGTGQPIFVVDGLPVDNSSQSINIINSSAPQGSGGIDFGNRAGDLNPDDIESVTVLKGAAATALYGARAKDGAIIITTKKGRKGQSSITFNSSVRFENVLKLPDLQNEFAQGNQGVYNIASTNGWGPKISEVTDRTFVDFLGRQVTLKAFPDNVKDFYTTGHLYTNSVSFEGGGDGGDFRMGLTNVTQTGVIPGEKLQKNVLSFNGGRNILKGLDVRTNINYTRTSANNRPVQSANNPNVIQQLLLGIPRTIDIHELSNNYYDPLTKQQITLTPGRTGNNPFWIIHNNNFSNVVDRIYGNAIITYSPCKWLTISDNAGTDFYNEFRKGVTRPGTIGALTGNFFTINIYNRLINNDLLLTLNHKVNNDVSLKLIMGHNVYETYYRRDLSDAQSLTVDELYSFSNAGSVTTTNTSSKKRLVGVYGDLGITYKDLLFLNITGRNDWSSTLPLAKRSYFYPSVSTSFIFSELLKNVSWLNYGKFRANWANVGSDAPPYSLNFAYVPVSVAFAQYGLGTTFPFGGLVAFSAPGTVPNSNLKPQNQSSYEAGVELRTLESRVNFDFTYYTSKTKDQIVNLAVPQSTGFSFQTINAGSIKNRGIEATLGLVPFRNKTITWETNINFSRNKQTVVLPPQIVNYTLASGFSGQTIRASTNQEFGMYGTAWLRDSLGDIIIDANTGLRRTINDQRLGNIYPDWMMGINNSITIKNFNLSFLVDIRKGGVVYSATASLLRTNGLAAETGPNRGRIFIDNGVILNSSTGKYDANTVPVQSMFDFWQQFVTTNTEGNVFNASYAKLREVRLSYKFPDALLRKMNFIKGLEIGLEGRNLWIIKSHVPHIDPEVNFFGTESIGEGVEFYSVPSSRSYGINLRVKL